MTCFPTAFYLDSQDVLQVGLMAAPTVGLLPNSLGATLDLNFTNSQYCDPRLTTTRASSATYFDQTGTMQTAGYNLALQSANLTLAPWSLNHAGVVLPVLTQNVVIAPDGTLAAAQVVMPAVSVATNLACVIQAFSGTAAPYSFSIYLQGQVGGEQVWLTLQTAAGAYTVALATLTTGWQRFSVPNATMTAGTCYVEIGTDLRASSGQSATPAQTFYAWGGQIEQSATVHPYVATTSVANGAPRIDYGSAPSGITNWIRNSTMQGVAAGTPGTLPTNWSVPANSGITTSVVGSGIEGGIPYIDVSFAGTTTGAANMQVIFETTTSIPAAPTELWTTSAYVRLIAGVIPNPALVIEQDTVSGTYIGAAGSSGLSVTTSSLASQRFSFTAPALVANTAFIRSYFNAFVNAALAISFTVRIGAPQLEVGSSANTWIPTSNSTVTVGATPLGLLIEESRTNAVRNSTMIGVATPSTPPTNWSPSSNGGLAYTVAATGTEFGMPFTDFQITGTTTGSAAFGCTFESTTNIAATSGQVWTTSVYMRLVAGSFGVSTPSLYITEYSSGGGFLTNGSANANVTTTLQRFTYTRTLNNASTAFIAPNNYFFYPSSGIVVNFTVRVFAPQLELGAFATSFMPTSTTAVTRAVDVASMSTGSWFSAAAGTLSAEWMIPFALTSGSNYTTASIDDGTQANTTSMFLVNAALDATMKVASSTVFATSIGTVTPAVVSKGAVAITSGLQTGASGGTVTALGTNASVPPGQTTLRIGSAAPSGGQLNGYVRRVRYWSRSLGYNEMIQTTT